MDLFFCPILLLEGKIMQRVIVKERLKRHAKLLKQDMTAVYYAQKRKDVGFLPKIIIIIALAYALSPVDLIPDFIPILGYLDDLIILPALLALSVKLIPKQIMIECKTKAIEEPILLKRNWFTACLIILLWITVIILILKKISLI
jgi:uncharacterized membrane protein YkvA (DUF1232 family)